MLYFSRFSESSPSRSVQHNAAYALLEYALKSEYGITLRSSDIVRGNLGKPYLRDRKDIHFSLSHTKGLACCLLSEYECGADCEYIRSYNPRVAKRAFSERELENLSRMKQSDADMVFTSIWTLKEAYGKTIGKGIGYGLSTVSFFPEKGRVGSNVEGFSFCRFEGGGYTGAVCLKTENYDFSEFRIVSLGGTDFSLIVV